MGRPSKRTPELIAEICERLSKGEPLAVICRDEHMPCTATVRNWIDEDEGVSSAIARAREDGEDAIVQDAMDQIDADPAMISTQFGEKVDPGDVALRKLRFESRLKLLSKWNPRRWGDRIEHEHKGKVTLETLVTGGE